MTKAVNKLFSGLRGFCALVAFMMMAIIVTDVGLRTLRIGSVPSAVEIIELSVVLVVFLSAAALQQRKGHLRVLLIYDRLPQGMKVVADFSAWLLFLLFFGIILWQGWGMFITSWGVKEVAINTRLPIYPVKFIFVLGCLFMVLLLIFDLGQPVKSLLSGRLTSKRG